MSITSTAHAQGSPETVPHHYQLYCQARNGCHYPHGPGVDSPAQAAALFLHTTPAFEGGGLRLWDHREQRVMASAEWNVESSRIGLTRRSRMNVFYDAELGAIARKIGEREALEQAIVNDFRLTV